MLADRERNYEAGRRCDGLPAPWTRRDISERNPQEHLRAGSHFSEQEMQCAIVFQLEIVSRRASDADSAYSGLRRRKTSSSTAATPGWFVAASTSSPFHS